MAATNASKLKAAAKSTVEKNLAAGAKATAQGIGESQRFGGTPDSPGGGADVDLSAYTCNGLPIPREAWPTFPISLTDQAKAAMKEERKNLPVTYSGRDRTSYDRIFDDDKKLVKHRDDLLDDDLTGLILDDPMKVLMERHVPAGHRGLFMSTKKCADVGLVRGVVEYRPVMVKNESGQLERVTCGGMFLASVPISTAEKADRYYERINREKSVAAVEKVQEQVEQVMSDKKLAGFAHRRGATDALVGIEEEDGERADAEIFAEPLGHE